MHITGIVAEYNPFHNGHLYQLNQTKELTQSDFVIAVMSGNFTQRGTPSIVNKFVRTQMALSSGIDMVLELPVPFATASAERFCEAAVSILNKTGIVNTISFGSEIGNIDLLKDIAHVLSDEPPALSQLIKNFLSKGYSFPRARQAAITNYFSSAEHNLYSLEDIQKAVENPNNILGIEYIKALIKYNTNISPLTIKRQVSNYHDTHIYASIASATAIRTQLLSHQTESIKQCMPHESYRLLMEHAGSIPTLDHLSDFLHYRLIFSNKESLYSLWDIPKDMIFSILNCFTEKLSILDVINEVTSKTYTRATVQRTLFRILLNILQDDMHRLEILNWIPYIRVLGCRKKATVLLSEMTKHASVPIITSLKDSHSSLNLESKFLLDYELKASGIYQYITKNVRSYHQDFTHPFIKL
ncbi:nucleotidyltransferase [Cellulosilyticum sp. I15G10I2]|uniref:nucleotidyltransferase n=1 Tax=Cellulosilyticum sp. I15G10I2 TaxID=1892843 RepID=UPI00085C31FA|nr:nucleotidyltransferase [Cellulosilyticum sp. I15G10I2]